MHLNRLSLTNFRTFSRLDLDIPREILLLVGGNAQGKTTLLEAIYFLSTFTSFHASSDRQLINFTLPESQLTVGRIVGEFTRKDGDHRLEVRLIREPNGYNGSTRFRKEVLLDGVKHRMNEIVGRFNAVIFLPQMARIIEEGPSERRRYLDMSISQVSPHYVKHIIDYNQTLTQRNALLKQLAERGGDPDQLAVWDGMLARHGAFIIKARIHAIREIEEEAKRLHYALTDGREVLRLDYQPAYDPLAVPEGQMSLTISTVADRSGIEAAEIEQGMLAALKKLQREEIARGVTTIGPHRDELRFLSNQVDLGDYGSRGQSRTALLALKLAEVNWLHQRTGEWPVLLLDEIMSELDTRRRLDLLASLSECDQAILTSTDLSMFDMHFVQTHTHWQVKGGMVNHPD
ncbi:MAG: DNA replication/repair protein RecF [Brevefilum sp.]|nr:DNA replication/repair protein RecF [Brevefilum sp.]MDT8381684.1 DNA replication/repair protein RecF [Brevefilum sp.]MDW7754754.1 DNA replication/repair protein RecF [Brevefilum sp.]